jgi:hypothetical protein
MIGSKRTFVGYPTNVRLESFVFAEFFSKTGGRFWETPLSIPSPDCRPVYSALTRKSGVEGTLAK